MRSNYTRNEKLFVNWVLHFWNLDQIVNIFLKKKTLIIHVSPKLGTTNNVVKYMPKKFRFSKSFDKQYGKRWKRLLKSPRQHPIHVHWSLWRKVSWKKSLLVVWKILRVFVNTLNADDKYSVLNRDILAQLIEIQLSKKQKNSYQFFSALWKSSSNFEHF